MNRVCVPLCIALLSVVGCSDNQDLPTVADVTERSEVAGVTPITRLQSKYETAWIGHLHNQAMADFVADKKNWDNPANGSKAARRCSALDKLAVKYTKLAADHVKYRNASSLRTIANESLRKLGCGSSSLRDMRLPSGPQYEEWTGEEQTIVVSGAYGSVIDQMSYGYESASTMDDAYNAIYSAMGSGAGLSEGDQMIVDIAVGVGLSSVGYWTGDPAYSANWKKIGWQDLLGAVGGAITTCKWSAWTCTIIWQEAAIGALIGATLASASAALG